ncbi:1,2-phenylacetyl-CoA epoxidase subunit PaaE [Hydrotalea sp.]|uniref:1,2-phenylacetyl-CoA epoxidase subunit PaaE n=1 Tax=Hydrotalea sp. TaxID=2881279 RepID=UPI0026259069|nr:1,2-phenylacetyl-CoA epoxidase subunit PaaE [Hydrotalea sp.]
MSHFYPVKVNEVYHETDSAVVIGFDIPNEWKSIFAYNAGQYINLRTWINGNEVRRTYSLCTPPSEQRWCIGVKLLPDGVFSNYAFRHLQPGDTIELMPPMGKFYTPLHAEQQKNYVAFAAGSGITPILAIITATLQTESKSNFTLVYGNKSRTDMMFKERLEALKNKYMERFVLIPVFSRERVEAPLNEGRIDAEKCAVLTRQLVDLSADELFICGPSEMITAVKDFLVQKGISEQHIHFELFTALNAKPRTATAINPVIANNTESKITIQLDGHRFYFPLAANGMSILDAARQQGADVPYACKAGVCSTCRAKLIKGKVNMEVNYALEPDEVAAGFILTCQSHPASDGVWVDYDVK